MHYTFDDITLVPQYSEFRSRSNANTNTMIGNYELKNPIISSNMETVTGPEMALAVWKAGGIGALHRFQSIGDNVKDYEKVKAIGAECLVSVGVNDESKHRAEHLYQAGARMFIIDIAHGHSVLMKEMLDWMKNKFSDIFIVAGNVATPEAVLDLEKWGADTIKCGVGQGSVCTTRRVTGHGVPSFTCLLECSSVASVQLIQDGGIRCSGDIVKSFVAGADFVMMGSMLSGTDESPGDIIEDENGNKCKKYMGSSSYDRKGITKEGISTLVPYKGPVKHIIESLVGGINSGMSYCNAKTLEEIPMKAKWISQSYAGIVEGLPHASLK